MVSYVILCSQILFYWRYCDFFPFACGHIKVDVQNCFYSAFCILLMYYIMLMQSNCSAVIIILSYRVSARFLFQLQHDSMSCSVWKTAFIQMIMIHASLYKWICVKFTLKMDTQTAKSESSWFDVPHVLPSLDSLNHFALWNWNWKSITEVNRARLDWSCCGRYSKVRGGTTLLLSASENLLLLCRIEVFFSFFCVNKSRCDQRENRLRPLAPCSCCSIQS